VPTSNLNGTSSTAGITGGVYSVAPSLVMVSSPAAALATALAAAARAAAAASAAAHAAPGSAFSIPCASG